MLVISWIVKEQQETDGITTGHIFVTAKCDWFQLTKVATLCEIEWHGVGGVCALYTEGGVVLLLN